MRTRFTGGKVRSEARIVDWVLVEDSRIVGVGNRDDAPGADRIVDLGGGALIPGFCDAHVHLPATGLYESGMDFRGERRAAAIVDVIARRAEDADSILFGGNFEDPLDEPIDRAVLDRAVGDRPALLARADMHSCVVSGALLGSLHLEGLEGVDRDRDGRPTGYLREKAASEAWRWFEQNLPQNQLEEAVRAALRLAASRGVVSVHEMFVVEWRGWAALEWYLDGIDDAPIDIVTYVADPDVGRIEELGFGRVGGDFFLDGSFGSHTAWMSDPYATAPPEGTPPTGIRYRDADVVVEFFMAAQDAGLQAAVHAIGDAAIEQAISAWERVADKVGGEAVRAHAHRIEHFECASDDHIERAARLGLAASVQPAFDLYWGGEEGLYARRIGWERARSMNRFATMRAAGLLVGAGSDSSVTPLDPFLQMRALRTHHVEEERVDARTALEMHTVGSHSLAGGNEARGVVRAGSIADIVWLDRDPVETSAEDLASIEVLGTWCRGRRAWPESEEG